MSGPHPVAESAKDIARAWGNKAWQIAISHKPLDDRDMRTLLLQGKEAVRNLINADFVVAADELITLRARLSRLSALLDEAEAALGPFMVLHDAFKGRALSNNSTICGSPTKAELSFGDLRLAASVAAKIAKEKSE